MSRSNGSLRAALVGLSLWGAVASPAVAAEEMSADETARQLSNPVSSIWSFQFQNNMTFMRGGPSHSYRGLWTTNFQPVMPVKVTDDWNVIVRPVFSFSSTPTLDTSGEPTLDSRGDIDRTSGIGQTSLITLLSPAKASKGLVWGAGPTFLIPTTTRDELSSRKYSIGPAAVALHMSEKWVLGLFPQYWWSVSGSNRRSEVSQANIQYFIWRSLGDGWQLGMSPNITYNRKADGGDAWTVPVGLGVSKTTKLGVLPVKFQLEAQAMVIHPDDFGARWNLRLAITPVLPALIKKPLF